MKTLRAVAIEALDIYEEHDESLQFDAGFDGGEFSGPAHAEMASKRVAELAAEHGYTYDDVAVELSIMANEP